jgi:outer membrane protein assembly factor BamB
MKPPRNLHISFLLLVLLAVRPAPAAPEPGQNWPQFRGPSGQGVVDATSKDLPLTWGEQKNVRWKTAIHGKAWSSPVVWGEQIWMTTATEDGHKLYAVCVDKGTGKIVYDLQLFDVPAPQYCIPFNSYASPTPVIEEGRVYVTFGAPGTACLDTTTGKVLWQRTDFVCNHYRGAGSSPILYGDKLIMNFDGSDFQFIVALDKNTGKTIWKTDRDADFGDLGPDGKPQATGDFRKAFSTPRIATFASEGNKPILISEGSKCLYAYNPETGNELWRVENRSAHSGSATPVIGNEMIYFCTGHGKTELWALKPGGRGLLSDTQVAWKVRKNVPTRGSVVLADGLIFMVDDTGIASCTDAASGENVWHERIGGAYSAAPIYADGRVYFFSQEGTTTVVAAAKEFKKLAENKLDDGFMAVPAVSGNAFFLRTKTNLYRVEGAAQ